MELTNILNIETSFVSFWTWYINEYISTQKLYQETKKLLKKLESKHIIPEKTGTTFVVGSELYEDFWQVILHPDKPGH